MTRRQRNEPGRVPGAAGTRSIWALASITLIGPLSIHMFIPVIPAVKAVFGIDDALAGLTFSITLFVMAFATLVYGSLSDRHGRRPVLLSGILLFTLGSAVSALAQSVAGLIAGRVIQALGAGCGVTLARAIARDAYGTDVLVKVIATLTMVYTLGPTIAPIVGGMLLDVSGFRAVFWFAATTGVLLAALAYGVIQETHPREARHPGSSGYLRNYAALFSHARFTAFVLQSGFATGTFLAMAAASSFLMKEYLGRSATEFGLYFLVYPGGFFFGNLVSSRLSQRVPIETMVLAGSIIQLAAMASLSAMILAGYLTPLVIFTPAFVLTFAQGIALPNAQVGAIRVMPSLAGTAAGVGVFCQNFLGAVFAQIYSLLADGTPTPMVVTVMAGSVLTLTAGIVPFLMKRAGRAADC